MTRTALSPKVSPTTGALRAGLSAALLLAATQASGAVDCTVVSAMVRLQGAELRLFAGPPSRPSAADLEVVRSAAAAFEPATRVRTLRDHVTAAEFADLAAFAAGATALAENVRRQDFRQVALRLADPQSRALAGRVGPPLDRLDCKPTEETPTSRSSRLSQSLSFMRLGPLQWAWSYRGLLALSMILCGSALVYQLVNWRTNRRSKLGQRHVVALPCTLRTAPDGEAQRAVVVDLSCRGAKLKWPGAATASSSRLTLDLGDLTAGATLKWHNAHFAGVRFDHDLTFDQIDALVAASRSHRVAPPPRKEKRRPAMGRR